MTYSPKNFKVEVSTNGSTWTNITNAAVAIEVDGGDRQTGDVYVYGQDTAVIASGKREPIDVTVKALYTEGTTDVFETVRAVYESGGNLYVRWSPLGGTTGQFQFSTDAGYVTSFVYPAGEAGSADVILAEFTVRTPKVTKSVIA